LTIPKVKDLVTLPQQKYDELFHSLEQNNFVKGNGNNGNGNGNNNSSNGNDNLLPSSSSQSMKDELIRFMKEIGGGSGSNYNSNKNDAPTTISPYSFSK
jgi:hypothetical protein